MRGAGKQGKDAWLGLSARVESCVFVFARFWSANKIQGGPSKTRLRIILRDKTRDRVSDAGLGRFPSRLSGLIGLTHAWFRRPDTSTHLQNH